MGVGLSFAVKGIIAVVLALIFFAVYERAPAMAYTVVETVDRTLEAVDINLIDIPRIVALTPGVEPDGAVTVTWTLNEDGYKKLVDSDFKAVFSYKKYPDDPIDDVCTVEKINHDTAKPGWACSVDNGEKTAILQKEGCTGLDCLDKLTGMYKIGISFEKKEGYITRKDEMETGPPFGIYTKTYLENFDRDVKACPDCNVKECKRKALIGSLTPKACSIYGVKVVYNRAFNELYPPIEGPVIKGTGLDSCEYPPSELPIKDDYAAGFKAEDAFKFCPVEGINKLYQKAASWVFFDAACGSVGMADETVKYVEKLFDFKDSVLGISIAGEKTRLKLSDCARKAEKAFEAMGWGFFLTPQDRDKYEIPEGLTSFPHDMAESDAVAGADKYVQDELPPVIRNLKASLTPEKNIKVSWDLPVGSNNVKSAGLSYMYRSFPSGSDVFTSVPVIVPLSKAARSYALTPKEVTGQYRFIITAESANPAADLKKFPKLEGTLQVAAGQADIGIYDDGFIEFYRDLIGVDDACNKDCDVAGKKEDALGDNDFGWKNVPGKAKKPEETYVYIARCGDSVPRFKGSLTDCGDNGGKFSVSCQLDKSKDEGEKRITGCTGKEVDLLYTAVLNEVEKDVGSILMSPEDKDKLLTVDCGESGGFTKYTKCGGWCEETGIKYVCKAKISLRNKLNELAWVYVS